ncbi:BcsR/BcsP family cellulose biosynthesis protein [Dyella japonica]|uniref:Uncharacterized protein n=1 Tax=Dyella japonica A8 TaxID=1217721 RepID=A0A075K0X0_9GAMM|nr:BcsR/BcsP family cellulose biosynthesis protein [Dyella japonica]AIF47804.1 hypothetical protein HY57_11270 [Dyella japonica A8]
MNAPQDANPSLSPSDIETYASYVPGMDAARYYDSQAADLQAAARRRWPLLADVLYPHDAGPGRQE